MSLELLVIIGLCVVLGGILTWLDSVLRELKRAKAYKLEIEQILRS